MRGKFPPEGLFWVYSLWVIAWSMSAPLHSTTSLWWQDTPWCRAAWRDSLIRRRKCLSSIFRQDGDENVLQAVYSTQLLQRESTLLMSNSDCALETKYTGFKHFRLHLKSGHRGRNSIPRPSGRWLSLHVQTVLEFSTYPSTHFKQTAHFAFAFLSRGNQSSRITDSKHCWFKVAQRWSFILQVPFESNLNTPNKNI